MKLYVMFLKILKMQRRSVSQIKYSLVIILELNGISEVQYKEIMIIDNE